jgi:hypothetical protein
LALISANFGLNGDRFVLQNIPDLPTEGQDHTLHQTARKLGIEH